MKNKKFLQKWMLCAATLLMIAPLANQSQTVHAKDIGQRNQPGLINTYGLAPNLKKGKGGIQSPNGKLGIELNSDKHGVNGTANSKYIHKNYFTGFLVANEDEKTGKLKTPGQPFGPTSSKFKYSWEGGKDSTTDTKKMSKWIVYMHPNNNED